MTGQKIRTRPREISFGELCAVAAGRKTVVLGGYSGLGYADPAALRRLVRALVASRGDRILYVAGATSEGIGAVYGWIPGFAAESGFRDIVTAGIVSSCARGLPLATQDYVVFVERPEGDWQVLEGGSSRFVELAFRTGGELVYYRGGEIAGSEIREALARGVRVTVERGPGTEADPDLVAARLARDPASIVDGTAGLVDWGGPTG